MFVKNMNACKEFTANDGCLIREVLHPNTDPVDIGYSLAVASVLAGKRSLQHKLVQTEVYYILAGQGRMHIHNEARDIHSGDVVLIPPGAIQWIENNGEGELQFIAIVSPPWREQDDQLAV